MLGKQDVILKLFATGVLNRIVKKQKHFVSQIKMRLTKYVKINESDTYCKSNSKGIVDSMSGILTL